MWAQALVLRLRECTDLFRSGGAEADLKLPSGAERPELKAIADLERGTSAVPGLVSAEKVTLLRSSGALFRKGALAPLSSCLLSGCLPPTLPLFLLPLFFVSCRSGVVIIRYRVHINRLSFVVFLKTRIL